MADEAPTYDVEKIIKKRINAEGETQYSVKWVGYKTPTWEPRENLADTSFLEEFEKNYVETPKGKGAATPKRKEVSTPKKKEVSTPKKKEVSTPKKKATATPKRKEASTPKKKETAKKEASTPKSKAVLTVGKTPKTAARLQLTPVKSDASTISSDVMESARRGIKRTFEEPTPAKPVVVSCFEEQETPSTSRSVSPERSSHDADVESNPAKRAKEESPDMAKETKTEEVPKTCSIM